MDRRRLVWMTAFASALVAVIGLAWAFAVPSGSTSAAPRGDATVDGDDPAPGASGPAGPSFTADREDPGDGSTTTYDSYTTLTRPPDTGGDEPPVPLAATTSLPRTTVTASPSSAAPTTEPSCIDCVTTTAPGPGATGGVCDTSVGRTTDPGCAGGTTQPTTASTAIDPCAVVTTFGCPGSSTTATAPTPTPSAPTATTAPPTTCFPVACPPATRAVP